MGNTSSHVIRWNVTFDHEEKGKKYIQAGKTLKGTIHAKLVRGDFPKQEQQQRLQNLFQLKLIGKEKSYTSSQQRSMIDNIIASMNMNLGTDRKDDIFAKTFYYRFHIPLPKIFPSSIRIEGQQRGSYYSIEYTVQLIELATGKQLTEEIVFHIESASIPATKPIPRLIKPKVHPIKSSTLFGGVNTNWKMGSILLGAEVLNTYIGRGSDLEVRLALQNQSTAIIHRIEILLLERTIWSNKSNYDNNDNNSNDNDITTSNNNQNSTIRMLSEIIDVHNQNDSYDGRNLNSRPGIVRDNRTKEYIKQQQQNIRNNCGIIVESEQTRQQKLLDMMDDDLKNNENKLFLPIPDHTNVTYTGEFGRIDHFLQINIYTTTKCTSKDKDISIEIPIRIGNLVRPIQIPSNGCGTFTITTITTSSNATTISSLSSSSHVQSRQSSQSRPSHAVHPSPSRPSQPMTLIQQQQPRRRRREQQQQQQQQQQPSDPRPSPPSTEAVATRVTTFAERINSLDLPSVDAHPISIEHKENNRLELARSVASSSSFYSPSLYSPSMWSLELMEI